MPQVYNLPVCEKESSTRGDPVSLDIGYRSGRELVAFVVPRERVYLAHCRKDHGIIMFPVAASRQSQEKKPASKTESLPLREKALAEFRIRFVDIHNSNAWDFSQLTESKDFPIDFLIYNLAKFITCLDDENSRERNIRRLASTGP